VRRVTVRRIVSGAQTGADRAALDAAIELGVECGGWVPRGRLAEDGVIPGRYPNLIEADREGYAPRTALNVRDSDATLIVSHGPLSGGSELTAAKATAYGRPWLHVDLARVSVPRAVEQAREWIASVRPAVLNVAGPRASKDPEIYARTREVVRGILGAPDPALKPPGLARSIAAFVTLPGVVAYLVPVLLAPDRAAGPGWVWSGNALLLVGSLFLLACVREFHVAGRGTLAPWSPPRALVTGGPYRWSRNPMYLSVLVVLLGWSVRYASAPLLVYAAAMAVAFHLRVRLFEEPRLRTSFGPDWDRYARRVRRWLGRRR
jgi:protein-S-isoprenylcysteine O-methyltransferase Ste14